jgi:hypothetical protein
MNRILRTFVAAISLGILSISAFADHHPTIDQLAWMTGSWDGQTGPNVLEENWSLPRSGTIDSLVKSTGPDGTQMVEIVHIEEAEGTLHLYLQQWDVPFNPRTQNAQKMVLKEIGENSVTFDAVTEGGIKTLGYSRPDADSFNINITTATDQSFTIPLKTQQR